MIKIITENESLYKHLEDFFKDFVLKESLNATIELESDLIDNKFKISLFFRGLQSNSLYSNSGKIIENTYCNLNLFLEDIKNLLNNPYYLKDYYVPSMKKIMEGFPEFGYDKNRSTNKLRDIYDFINQSVLCFHFENNFMSSSDFNPELDQYYLLFFDNVVKLKIKNKMTKSYVLFDLSLYDVDGNTVCSNYELENLILEKLDHVIDKGFIDLKKDKQ